MSPKKNLREIQRWEKAGTVSNLQLKKSTWLHWPMYWGSSYFISIIDTSAEVFPDMHSMEEM